MPPHPTYLRSILTLRSHPGLRLGLPSCLFPSGVPTTTLYTLLLSPTCATCRAHHTLLDLITVINAEHKAPRYELPYWCWKVPGATVRNMVVPTTRRLCCVARYKAIHGVRWLGGWWTMWQRVAVMASVGRQQGKPRKLGTMVGNMAHIRRRHMLALCTMCVYCLCYGGKITLCRSVYGCQTRRRVSLTDRRDVSQ